ncbi:AzlD domain-containing protein [Thaumasiovibrio subtropicus]|uniref:AzlD domain-containing protein n=1 Tax=Thaumasiovibrio subtropicus TaxID=1891207 RepID=UPI000B35278F|nr:AzlD domain-containing protein [Thaumasiovibrio subtropicus]
MILLSILAMTLVVFLSRYLFLAPTLPLKLGSEVKRFLKYSSPAILTVILAPIMFLEGESQQLMPLVNPYLIAAVIATLLAWKTANVLLTTGVSFVAFLLMNVFWG